MRTTIGGVDVLLDGDNIPEFSYSLNELTEFTKVKGSNSTTFDIPASNSARAALGGPSMQETPIGETPIRIGDGGQVLFEGVCVPIEWTESNIKVAAYGDNATWFDSAKNTKCVDVDLGNTEVISAGHVVDRWTEERADLQSSLAEYSYFFPVIDYGFMGTYTGTTNITLARLKWAVSLRALMAGFFQANGFSVVVKGSLVGLWNRLMLPSSGHTYKAVNNTATVFASQDVSLAPFQTIESAFDTLGQTSSIFNLPSAGNRTQVNVDIPGSLTVKYRVRLRYVVLLPDEQPRIQIFIASGFTTLTSKIITVPNTPGTNDVLIEGELTPVDISANTDTFTVFSTFTDFNTDGGSLVVVEGSSYTYSLEPVAQANIYDGVVYNVASAISPSLSMADVISSVGTMLRLAITTNQLTNEVTFQHYDDYLRGIEEGIDWSERVTHSPEPAKVMQGTPAEYVFKFAEDDKDEAAINYNGETIWTAEGTYETDGREEERVNTIKFAATRQANRFGGAVVPWIKEENETADYNKCKPRILVHGGFTEAVGTVMTFNGTARNYCPRFYFTGSGGSDINIGFGDDNGNVGTVNRYWKASLLRSTKPLLRADLRVYDDEFMNFDFGKPRLVNDGHGDVWMYVQTIKGKRFGDESPVECELIPV